MSESVLIARAAAYVEDRDKNSAALVLAEDTIGRGDWLEIQRSLEFDKQDRELELSAATAVELGLECPVRVKWQDVEPEFEELPGWLVSLLSP